MKCLVIQTAFIGDAILATALLESIHRQQPDAEIHFLVKKGHESLLEGHPFITKVWTFDKTNGKLKNIFSLIQSFRALQFDYILNIHRFASSGFITAFSGAKITIGFDKNPLSFLFTKKVKHQLDQGQHEIVRNHALLLPMIQEATLQKPKLYPQAKQQQEIKDLGNVPFITISPCSVWFTKQLPAAKWIAFINQLPPDVQIHLLGAANEAEYIQQLMAQTTHPKVANLAGKLSLLGSAALMSKAIVNYVNDSAPLHLASAMNAPTAAVYCSTIPAFGFGPLADRQKIIEIKESLSCRPCGLHGLPACPQGHFKCAMNMDQKQMDWAY